MAKVLSSISFDSPASPLSASVNDTFSFAGTPSFAGGGGVQRYDFKWEVDSGGGYVTIAAATGLTSSDTNPLVNTNSQSQNAITVTCAEAGSYTIRMVGAPTSGGSYTVLSSTQTVEVALAGVTGTLAAVESGADSFAGSGTIAVSGTMTPTESGADSLSASGEIAVAGDLAATESGSDSFAATGTVTEPGATGTLAAVESGTDTLAGSGAVAISGSLVANDNGSDAFSSSGSVAVSGLLSVAETGVDGFSGSGSLSWPDITGSMAAQETGNDNFSGGTPVQSVLCRRFNSERKRAHNTFVLQGRRKAHGVR